MNRKSRDWRHAQANREALFALGIYGLYFVWWYVCAYGMGDTDPEQYTYLLGLPAWFFYSCILGYPLVTILLWIVVRLFFRAMPLDDEPGESPEDEVTATDGEDRA
ncbi:putative membrane protein YhdT [Desulfobaculum xiamenense]|uniref:Putative membrane protein YhdT n=1 Tax=Desulfobaculum xiamenense TaxID=995050 RepID=A0A846QDM9_9BACT|nr:YhdT family protein [Desulfobaculum xiamenense]NJB66411.1 putative membrane protein YhdT [Desulfobaculum xiamenense]